MWRDLLKAQISVARQKLRMDDMPLPDEDEPDCADQIIEYIEKFRDWTPKLKYELVNPTVTQALYVSENLVPNELIDESRYYRTEYGNPIIEKDTPQYRHGVINHSVYSLTGVTNEDACLILKVLEESFEEVERYATKIKRETEIEGTPYVYNYTKIESGARFHNGVRIANPSTLYRFHCIDKEKKEVILKFESIIIDFYLPDKEGKTIEFTSNYEEIRNTKWWL